MMSENPQAFPMPASEHSQGGHFEENGMTLLDYFAGQALAGLLATNTDFHDEQSDGWEWHAKASYAMARAMLNERANHD